MSSPTTFGAIRGPIVDKDGNPTWAFLKKMQEYEVKLSNALDGLGQAAPGLVVTRSGNPGILSQGLLTGFGRNGDVVTFADPFDTVPVVRVFAANSLMFSAADSANDQLARYEALEITKTGFTIKAAIIVDNFATTLRVVLPSGGVAIKNLAAEAYDDQYTFQYDVTVNAAIRRSIITLGFNEAVSGGAFTLRGTATWTNNTSSPVVLTNKTKAITIDGAGLSHEFKITEESQEENGGSLNSFDSISWNSPDSSVTERDATPDTSHYVLWTAVEGASG